MKTTTSMMSLVVGSTLLLGGCVFAPSGSDEHPYRGQALVQPTLGQELIDLDRARDAGLVSQAEYEQARKRLLDGRHQ